MFLIKQGFKIFERNVPNKFGEIDIVAQKDKGTYFFEVKTGRLGSGINPAENLNPAKIKKFLKSAQYYCLTKRVADYRAQGIVVLVSENKPPSIEVLDIF